MRVPCLSAMTASPFLVEFKLCWRFWKINNKQNNICILARSRQYSFLRRQLLVTNCNKNHSHISKSAKCEQSRHITRQLTTSAFLLELELLLTKSGSPRIRTIRTRRALNARLVCTRNYTIVPENLPNKSGIFRERTDRAKNATK